MGLQACDEPLDISQRCLAHRNQRQGIDRYINFFSILCLVKSKVIREKSRGEGSLIVQDTIENVSEPKIFF